MMTGSSLKTIKIKTDPVDDAYIDDCLTIQNILIDRGFYATLEQCHIMWKLHSECYGAGWLILYENSESIYEAIKVYFDTDAEVEQA